MASKFLKDLATGKIKVTSDNYWGTEPKTFSDAKKNEGSSGGNNGNTSNTSKEKSTVSKGKSSDFLRSLATGNIKITSDNYWGTEPRTLPNPPSVSVPSAGAKNPTVGNQQSEFERLSTYDVNAGKSQLEVLQRQLENNKKLQKEANNLVIGYTRAGNAGDNLKRAEEKYKSYLSESENINSQIRLLQRDIQQAGNIKKAKEYDAYRNEGDFSELSTKGAAIQNPSKEDADGKAYIFGWRPGAKQIGNIVTYSRDNYDKILDEEDSESRGVGVVGKSLYHYMTDDEVSIYNYLLAKNGESEAQKYLSFLEETLNYRYGTQTAQNVRGIDNAVGRTAATAMYGAGAGLDQFVGGAKQFFSDERLPTTATQYGSAYIREDLAETGPKILGNSLGQMAYDAVTTTANMAPSILLSSLTGGLGAPAAVASGIGVASLGMSASGNAYGQALSEGYGKEEARSYSLLVGASEAALQYLLGGVSKLGGKLTGNVAKNTVQNIDNALLRIAADTGIHMVSEGSEEYLQEVLEPVFRNLCFDENNEIKLVSEDAAYSFLLGALTSGFMEGGSIAKSGISVNKAGEAIRRQEKYEALLENALTMDPSSKTGRLASQLKSGALHVNNSNIGELYLNYAAEGGNLDFVSAPVENTEMVQKAAQQSPESVLYKAAMEKVTGQNISSSIPASDTVQENTSVQRRPQNISVAESKEMRETMSAADENISRLSRSATVLGEEGQKRILDNYNGKSDPAEYFASFVRYYNAGLNGQKATEVQANGLTLEHQLAAYESGAKDRYANLQKERGNVQYATVYGNESGFVWDQSKDSVSKSTAQTLNAVGKALGVKVVMADQVKDGAANASYENGVVTIARDAQNPVMTVFSHELTHRMQELAPEAYRTYRDYVACAVLETGNSNAYIADIQQRYQKSGEFLTQEGAMDELAAEYAEVMMGRTDLFDDFVKQNRTAAQKIADCFKNILEKLKSVIHSLTGEERQQAQRVKAEMEEAVKHWESAFKAAEKQANRIQEQKNTASESSETRYSINPEFVSQIDNWDGKSDKTFNVGTTSQALKSIGVKDRGIIWHSRKISKILREHDGMTRDIIKQVPEILEHPVAVLKSKNSESRIVVFGEIVDAKGAPVTAILELNPTNKGGQLLDMNVIASAYGKDSNPSAFIRNSELLYLDTNRKRTQSWMQGLGLQLPSDTTALGSIGSITYQDGKVKIVGVPYEQYIQGASKDTIFESGKGRYSIKYDENNRPFVVVDEDILDGVPKNQWVKAVKDNLRAKFPDGVTVGNNVIYIDKQSIREMTFSKYTQRLMKLNPELYSNKIRATNNADEIIKASRNYINEALVHPRKDNIQEFARGDILLSINGQGYSANVIVAMRSNGKMMLYDLLNIRKTDIKEKTRRSNTVNPQKGETGRKATPSNTSISNSSENVNGKFSLKGSSDALQAQLDEAVKKYGAIPAGEKPARDIQVPKKATDNKNERISQTVRTVLEAKATPDIALPTIEEMALEGKFSYQVLSDKKAISDAEETIKNQGWASSLSEWLQKTDNGSVNKNNTAMGWALYNNAVNSGDIKTSINILENMVLHQRNAAQAVQASRILKKLSPEGQLYGVMRSAENLTQEIKERYGKDAEITVDKELAEKFLKAPNETAREEALEKLYMDIGRQLPSRFMDKWNAWRYLAMLGNPRTHVRNIAGNALFMPAVAIKDLTGTAIESVAYKLSGGKLSRTKGTLTHRDMELVKAAWNDYPYIKDEALGDGKYSDLKTANQSIEKGRKIFHFKPLEAARKANSKALDVEDAWFSQPHYSYALAQYAKANHISAETIKSGLGIDAARAYAIKEAQKATYRDSNAFSNFVSSLGRRGQNTNWASKAASTLVEGVLPFRKTPANILARGVEYSPIGLLKGLSVDLYQMSQGKKTGAEVIDNVSAGLTGTGILALGAFLAAQGILRGRGGDDDDKRNFYDLMGYQDYALCLPDGTSVTLDWMAPEALPLFVGANLYEQMSSKNSGLTLSNILDSISNISEPMLEMSMLQSLNDLFDSVGYASSQGLNGLAGSLVSAATSYLTQGIPTLAGQLERTAQQERMTTYTDNNGFLTGDAQYFLGSASAKIPGWDYHQIPYIDAWGRKESTGESMTYRAFSNMLNPAYVDKTEENAMEKELLRLYDATDEASVFPERAKRYFNVGNERIDLTADQYVTYATKKGQKSYQLLSALVQSDAYKNSSDEGKCDLISECYAYANARAKQSVSSYDGGGYNKMIATVKKTNVDELSYLILKEQCSGLESLKDTDGETIDNSLSLLKMRTIYNVKGLTDEQRKAMFEDFGVGKKVRHYNKALVNSKLAQMEKQ
ncbi:MAG: hypothetical protein DBY45_01795 [Clostridiales bacterium]|nr:MAG: hypothetical protein DBY45_01795 [Clostridiales bacterium]